MLVEEEAGLAAEAALSASRALSLLGERALASTLWASCSSASRPGVAAWGCWVGPTHDGGCIERAASCSSLWAGDSQHPRSFHFLLFKGRKRAQPREETGNWDRAGLAGATSQALKLSSQGS